MERLFWIILGPQYNLFESLQEGGWRGRVG